MHQLSHYTKNDVVDIRFTTTFQANSSIAAAAAVELLNAKNVLLRCVFVPAKTEDDEPLFYFYPPMIPEYEYLREMSWETWYVDYVTERNFTPPDILEDIMEVDGLDKIWLLFDFPQELFGAAMNLLIEQTQEDKFVIVSEYPLPKVAGLLRADPTGHADFNFCGENASGFFGKIKNKAFSIGSDSKTQYKTITLP